MNDRTTRAWLTSYRAALVLPVSATPIVDGAVLVEGERIVWVGPVSSHPPAPNARVVELGHAVISPGLVNAHTHLDLSVMRGLFDGLSFFEWIRAVVAARPVLSPDEWLDSARLGVIEALESGITTIGDTAPTGASFDAMREFGVRGTAYIEVFGPDPAQARPALAELAQRIGELRARETGLVRLGVSPHAPYSVSDELYVAAAAWARERRLPIATHVAESVAESDLISRGEGPFADMLRSRGIAVAARARTPVALLRRLAVLGNDTLLIHCVHCDGQDVETIDVSQSHVVTCPMSNRYFGHGDAPWLAFKPRGIAVGSDSLASNGAMDLLREARIVEGVSTRDVTNDGANGGTSAGAWRIATVYGSQALRRSDETGSLEKGKQADLAAFALPPGTTDTNGVAVGPQALLTVVAGSEKVCDGRVLADVAGIRSRVAAASARLRQWRRGATPG